MSKGSRGGKYGSASSSSGAAQFVGRTTRELFETVGSISNKAEFAKTIGLKDEDLTQEQYFALKRLVRAIEGYDRQYGDNSPYKIKSIEFENIQAEEDATMKEIMGSRYRNPKPVIQFSMVTVPQVDNAYIRMLDTKYRQALLGAGGRWYTYSSGKKTSKVYIDDFKIGYGETR